MESTIGKYREIFIAELLQSCLEFCNQVLRVRNPSLPGVLGFSRREFKNAS